MRRAAACAGLGAAVGVAAGILSLEPGVLSELRGEPGGSEGSGALDALAFALRSWVPACTAVGLAVGLLGQLLRERPLIGSASLRGALTVLGALAWLGAGTVVLRAPHRGNTPGGGGLVGVGAGSHSGSDAESARAADPRPNVLLVVLDTTRRDRLSLYGYERATTPELERLASSATVFERAYATSSWTCPSHASLFTGLYPFDHGVSQAAWTLAAEQETLAERLAAGGYRTVGIVGNPMVGRRLGFDQGFEQYHETWREEPGPDARHPAVRHFARALDERDPRPLFTFVNLIEPHSPYTDLGAHGEAFVPPDGPAIYQNHWRAYYLGRKEFADGELEQLGHRYDAELRHTDTLVGELVSELSARGELDRTLLVITSDHGENLGEHGMVDHVFSLFEPTVAVPLLVRFPQRFPRGRRDPRPVQLVDVHASVLAAIGLEASGHGRDLAPEAPAEVGLGAGRAVLLSYDYPKQALGAIGEQADDPILDPYRRRLFALVEDGLKLIVSDDGSAQLFDLEADPHELVDLAPAGHPRLEALRRRVDELLVQRSASGDASQDGRPHEAGELDERTLEELRSLGYAE